MFCQTVPKAAAPLRQAQESSHQCQYRRRSIWANCCCCCCCCCCGSCGASTTPTSLFASSGFAKFRARSCGWGKFSSLATTTTIFHACATTTAATATATAAATTTTAADFDFRASESQLPFIITQLCCSSDVWYRCTEPSQSSSTTTTSGWNCCAAARGRHAGQAKLSWGCSRNPQGRRKWHGSCQERLNEWVSEWNILFHAYVFLSVSLAHSLVFCFLLLLIFFSTYLFCNVSKARE